MIAVEHYGCVWGPGGGDELTFEDWDNMVRVDNTSVAIGR